METFKLIVAYLISPLVISLGITAAGWIFWFRRKQRAAIVLLAAASGILLIGGLPVMSYGPLRDSEYRYRPLDLAKDLDPARSVLAVILGTGINPDPYLPPNSQVSGSYHARLLEGVRIYRSRPDVRLLVSVAGRASVADKQQFLASMISILALEPGRVGSITEAENTADEADLAKHQWQGEQVVVVTSAGHMPRAMQVFQDAGLHPLAAPTEFYFHRQGDPHDKPWTRWLPSEGGIGGTHQLLYEWIASVWQRVRKGK